jgi:RNA polymerase sigma-B factor
MSSLPAIVDLPPTVPPSVVELADKTDDDLFGTLSRLPAGARRSAVRAEIVARHLPLVRSVALRYRYRGEPLDDLLQVGAVGLVKAVDRFEVERGLRFSTFAVPTVSGEIKRHFRDHTWSVHVRRGLQERTSRVSAAAGLLAQELGRSATVAELAKHCAVSDEQVLEALECARSYSTRSLNEPFEEDGELGDMLGGEDPALTDVVLHESLRPALDRLPARLQRIVSLRFYGNLTQAQIAEKCGISQMHVSRLLAQSLAMLRAEMAD